MVGALALGGGRVRTDWLDHRIYPGALEKMAPLVQLAIVPAVKLARGFPEIDRWFFLRRPARPPPPPRTAWTAITRGARRLPSSFAIATVATVMLSGGVLRR